MQKDDAATNLAQQASEALADLLRHESAQIAAGDRFDRCSETLDELARAVVTIGEIVDQCTAPSFVDDGPEGVADKARELSTAIVRRRNSLLAESAAARMRIARPVPVRRAG